MSIQILPYQFLLHQNACLEIFKSNMPKFFTPDELEMFRHFLKTEALSDPYFVAVIDEEVVGCGGYYYNTKKEQGILSWGMVHANLHGKGIGQQLTQYRIKHLLEEHPNQYYTIETSQHTFPFYEKMGFVTQKITKDGFGPGLDNYYMVLDKRIP